MLAFRKSVLALIAILGIAAFGAGQATAQEKSIVVASTTAAQDTGLFEYLLPLFTNKTGIAVKVLALGTGQALDIARRGQADVVLVNNRGAEQRFIVEGDGVKRLPVMYNDFVLVGPKSDLASIKGMKDVSDALQMIKDKQASFISRGDRSGTHFFELMLWNRDVGVNIERDHGEWYKSARVSMEQALNLAASNDAYALSDRGTWLHQQNKRDQQILVEGDARMFNQYAVILVDPAKHPNVKREFGQALIDWLVSPEGQSAIGNFKIDGQQLFYPNADDPSK